MVTLSSLQGRTLTRIPLTITAFNSDLKPYAKFEWVTSPTSFRRLARDASQTIAQQPTTATNSVVSTVKHTKLPQDNRRSGPAIAQSIKAEPPPNAPRGPRNNTPSQASRFPRLYPDTPKGPSRNLGKAPVRSAEAPLGPSPRSSSMQPQRFADSRASSATPASVLSPWHPPELVHPSRRPLIDNTGPLNAAARNQSSAQTVDRQGRAHFSPELTQNSSTPSQQEAGQVRMPYSPTPGPSSYSARPYAKPTTNVRSPNTGGTKTPGPPDGKKGMGSVELGTPRLHSTYKDLPSTAAQEPVATRYSRAAGKQPVRSVSCSVAVSSPSASQAQTTHERQTCKACNRKHIGECTPVCSNCGRRHQDTCHRCDVCSKWHVGECRYCEKCNSVHYAECRECTKCKTWHVGCCDICKTCEKRHKGACAFFRPPPKPQLFSSGSGEKVTSSATESFQPRKKATPLPDIAATQVETPLRARPRGVTTPITPGTAASTRSAEMPNNNSEPCKHRQKGQECEKCTCGCENCRRPGKRCAKQRAEARNREDAGKRKADSVDPDVKVEPSASDAQLSLQPKKKPRTRDSVDPVVKVEESASHMQLSLLAKKLPKKKKPRTRDSVGSWYDPIAVD